MRSAQKACAALARTNSSGSRRQSVNRLRTGPIATAGAKSPKTFAFVCKWFNRGTGSCIARPGSRSQSVNRLSASGVAAKRHK
jgi:hypothetical protein